MTARNEKLRQQLKLLPYSKTDFGSVDYTNSDRTKAFEVSLVARGTREIRERVLKLASLLKANSHISEGFLLLSIDRSTPRRTMEVWTQSLDVIRPEIAKRLRLIAYVDGVLTIDPKSPETEIIAKKFATVLSSERSSVPEKTKPIFQSLSRGATTGPATTWRALEVEKYLVCLWMTDPHPVNTLAIIRRVGCDYRTAMHALQRLRLRGMIRQGEGRRVQIDQVRPDDWSNIFLASQIVYQPVEYVDTTGQAGVTDRLRRRFLRIAPAQFALGGIEAARKWDPDFNLNGTPRLDIVFHSPGNSRLVAAAHNFVGRLDAALEIKKAGDARSTVLVVHPLARADSMFVRNPSEKMTWADPVETVIHLNAMGLTSQANDLVKNVRSGRKHHVEA